MAETRLFHWQGRDKSGRRVTGEVSSGSSRMVRVLLHQQGIRVTRIKRQGPERSLVFGRPNSADIALVARQLATLVKAQIPLAQSLEVVAKSSEKPALGRILLDVRDQVSRGHAFAEALGQHPRQFDPLFCSLVRAGEQAGALTTMLERLAAHREKTEALKAKIRSAMKYPVFILLMASLVSLLLLIEVVPRFEDIFAGFGAELPALTRMVVSWSRFVQAWWLTLICGVGLLFLAYRMGIKRSESFATLQDRLALRLPVLGALVSASASARFARTLSTTLVAGQPLLEALEASAGAPDNRVYRAAVHQIREQVMSGIQLHLAMSQTGVFPALVVQMLAIGEEAGSLDTMLERVAGYYEERVDNTVDSLTSLLEPVAMAVLGLIVGGLIVAMYLPVFSMGNIIGGAGHP